jgi:hypothetical protein
VGAQKLDILAELNASLQAEGKLYTDVAWGLAEPETQPETTDGEDSSQADSDEATTAVTGSEGCRSSAGVWPLAVPALLLPVLRRKRTRRTAH